MRASCCSLCSAASQATPEAPQADEGCQAKPGPEAGSKTGQKADFQAGQDTEPNASAGANIELTAAECSEA